ncbi:hypothetical protein SRHO_G00195730 [Serrasalmus rhombeus]
MNPGWFELRSTRRCATNVTALPRASAARRGRKRISSETDSLTRGTGVQIINRAGRIFRNCERSIYRREREISLEIECGAEVNHDSLGKLPHEKHHNQPYSGIAPFIKHFEDPRDAPPPTRAETREERLERKRREKMERRQTVMEAELKLWDPHNDQNAQGDAFKTLFVARINYDTTESKLRREFEVYGPIKRIYIVYNKRTGKPRGYAFIEYEHERDMHSAYL